MAVLLNKRGSMDRNIVYPGGIPLDTDLLASNRNAMIAVGALIRATLGTAAVIDGLEVQPTTPAGLAVSVAPGSITALSVVDQNAYGSMAAVAGAPLMKMGINTTPVSFGLAAPSASGQSVVYLIQATFQEADVDPVVLPYYNAADPQQPYLGPDNSGAALATRRRQSVQLQLKAGAPATTGTQLPPPVDAGWTALALILVSYGQTEVTAGHITAVPTGAVLPYKLPMLRPGFSTIATFVVSGNFVVPAGVSRVKVTVIGGGGAGGTHATLPAAGGGAGGQAVKIVAGLVPGASIAVTVGTAGAASATPADGGAGGTSSFGSLVSATGGSGGMGGSAALVCAGAAGGGGVGGDINFGGAYGTDAIVQAGRGGDGGGPGGGRGSTGLIPAVGAPGWGGGGGGGGASAPGGGTGAQGGAGGAGLVVVEY
jgi:hypothetical protein